MHLPSPQVLSLQEQLQERDIEHPHPPSPTLTSPLAPPQVLSLQEQLQERDIENARLKKQLQDQKSLMQQVGGCGGRAMISFTSWGEDHQP